MRVTCDRCLRRYDVPDAALKGRKIRARCKCGARILVTSGDASSPESSPESKGRPVRWFVDITSWEPITMEMRQLERAFAAGRIDADTLVWCKGMPDWRRLRDVDELAERLLAAPPSAGLRSSRPLSSRPAASTGELQPSATVPPRSRTPQASYYVPSAGDTMPLQRLSPSEVAAAEASADLAVEAEGASLLDELERTTTAAVADGAVTRSEFPAELDAETSAPSVAPATLETTPEAAGAEPVTPGDAAPESKQPRASKIEIAGRDVTAALAEAALFATPDSLGPVAVKSDAGGEEAGGHDPVSKTAETEPPLAHATESDSVGPQSTAPPSAASQPPASRGASRDLASPSAAAPRTQRSRNRRRSSSEETPAQKPSSLSVPPRVARSHRGRALVAVCGTLALIWFVGRATMEQSATPVAVNEVPSASEPAEPLEPTGSVAQPSEQTPAPVKDVESEQHAARQPERTPEVEARPLQPPRAQATGALQPAQPPKADPKPAASPAPPIAARPATIAPPAPKLAPPRPAPAPPRVAAPSAPATQPAATAAAAVAAPVLPPVQQPAPKPGPFDMSRAEQQMMMAAQAATSCGQAGPQRGSGQVKVLVEPWGRVVRVTHLEQGFVGTPVGICVMQAYQQLQVPPFEGGTRSLIGSFDVK